MKKWIAARLPASTKLWPMSDRALRQVLHDYFAWATTTTMSRYHQSANDVPNGLSIPHWSWDGLQVYDSTADHRYWPQLRTLILTIAAEPSQPKG
jgi:hypothetical protein